MPDRSFYYDTIAHQFDAVMNPYEMGKRVRLIFDTLLTDPLAGRLVLDAGCGSGVVSALLAGKGARVVSLDISHNLLVETRRKTGGDGLAQGSLQTLAFAADTFDYVVSTEVIEHTPSPARSVSELLRVLKPGGILVLTVPHRLWRFSVTVANLLGVRQYRGYENWVGRRELAGWLQAGGGEIEQMVGFNLFPVFYRPFLRLLDAADNYQSVLAPLMVNIGVRVKKRRG